MCWLAIHSEHGQRGVWVLSLDGIVLFIRLCILMMCILWCRYSQHTSLRRQHVSFLLPYLVFFFMRDATSFCFFLCSERVANLIWRWRIDRRAKIGRWFCIEMFIKSKLSKDHLKHQRNQIEVLAAYASASASAHQDPSPILFYSAYPSSAW